MPKNSKSSTFQKTTFQREAPKDEDDDFDLFASDEDKAEVEESPKKVAKIEPKKANKGQKQVDI